MRLITLFLMMLFFVSTLFADEKGKNMNLLDVSNLEKSASMMAEDEYWELISESLKITKTKDEQIKYLYTKIVKMTAEKIIGFSLRTDYLLSISYSSELWCAAYIINGGCSDDGFEYFRLWLISLGKQTFLKAMDNPDSLVNELDGNIYELESLNNIAFDAFNKRTEKYISDYIDYEKFYKESVKRQELEFNWSEENPESMKLICPKLFEKVWK